MRIIYVLLILCSCSSATVTPRAPNSNSLGGPCEDTNCANYLSQEAAQNAFNADPECRNDLDHDSDGIACEQYISFAAGACPNTANCGCSNIIKAECGGPCCRWIVGSGCKCK